MFGYRHSTCLTIYVVQCGLHGVGHAINRIRDWGNKVHKSAKKKNINKIPLLIFEILFMRGGGAKSEAHCFYQGFSNFTNIASGGS